MALRLAGVALLVALTAASGCAALPAAVAVAQASRRPAPPGPGTPTGAPTIDLLPADAARLADEPKLVDLTFATHRFLLLGSPPTLLRENCVRGPELRVVLVSRATRRIVYEQFQGAAAGELTADYSQGATGVYELTEWTDDPRARAGEPGNPGAPFVATRVVIAPDGRCYPKRRLLLEPEPGNAADIQRWHDQARAALADPDPATLDDFYDALLHVRNLAVNHPDEALAALKDLQGHLGDRVHPSEVLSYRQGEIAMIRELRPDPRTAGRNPRTARASARPAPRPAATAPAPSPIGPVANPTNPGVHEP